MDKLQRKELAVECMQRLGIYKPYIRKFKSGGKVTQFENFGGYYIDSQSELAAKIREVEAEYDVTVYAVTNSIVEGMYCHSMLCIGDYAGFGVEDYLDQVPMYNEFYVHAYVWNKDCPQCSEFGDIYVQTFGGGLKRLY